MSSGINKLYQIANKPKRVIIGLMSGTSLDGLDIALCKISGTGLNSKAVILHFETVHYSDEFKDDIKNIFSKRQTDLEKVTLLNAKIGTLHAEMINHFLTKHGISAKEIDCIASHGQTIYHAPKRMHQLKDYPNATFQIGDADHIAVKTGIATISDFRQKHVAAGGEGAPLALYGDYILFSSNIENRILLNIGGISNFTYLPKLGTPNQIVCTDCGPGNTLIDALCKKHFNVSYDSSGDIARKGKVNQAVLDELLEHPFFRDDLPKTTGPELFNLNFVEQALADTGAKNISPEDLIVTVSQLTVEAIMLTIKKVHKTSGFSLYLSGGGANNLFLREQIALKLPENKVLLTEDLGIAADAKEALLFALLANETLCGSAMETNAGPRIMMGKISLPD